LPRKFDSEIRVGDHDEWVFRGNEITQEDVLLYFKQNLKEDEAGIYIDNRFGDLEENGYIEIRGFALQAIYFEWDEFLKVTCDDKRTFSGDEVQFFRTNQEEFFFSPMGNRFLKYRISRNALGKLMDFLEESSGEYFLRKNETSYPILLWEEEISVEIPPAYRI
jgi:hypothetical protein